MMNFRPLLFPRPVVLIACAALGLPGRAPAAEPAAPAPAAVDPGPVNARLRRAESLAREGKLAEALVELQQAAEADARRFEVPALAALVLLQGGEFDQAEESLDEARALAPAAQKERLQGMRDLITRARADQEQAAQQQRLATESDANQRRRFENVVQVHTAARQVPQPEGRRIVLHHFLDLASYYLRSWPDDRRMWMLVAATALEVDRREDGVRAREALDRLGLDAATREESAELSRLHARLADRWGRFAQSGDKILKALAERPPPGNSTHGAGWQNSLGQSFVRLGNVLMASCETNVGQYWTFVRSTGRTWTWAPWQDQYHPAINLSWQDAAEFCRWLTYRERLLGRISNQQTYRLPTDVEWSQAIGMPTEPGATPHQRNNKVLHYEWGGTGGTPPDRAGNFADEQLLAVDPAAKVIAGYDDGAVRTAPVGEFPANANGLVALAGNVQEFCDDWYDDGRTVKVVRGSSWAHAGPLASGARYALAPTVSSPYVGFRIVLVTGN